MLITKLKAQDGRKMLALGMTAGLLLAAPLGIRAYANQDDTTTPPEETDTTDTETTPEEDTTTEDPVVDEPTQEEQEETPVDETPVEQTDEPEEVPEEPGEGDVTDDPTVADLQAAIAIAALEHPDVEVISAKVKTLEGSKVYKVVFADGWIAYVSAETGDVMLLKDQNGQKRTCHNFAKKYWLKRHHNWHPSEAAWRAWSAAWLKKQQWAAAQYDWQWQEDQQTDETSTTDPTAATTDDQTAQTQTLRSTTQQTQSQSDSKSKPGKKSQPNAATSQSTKKSKKYSNFKSGYQKKLQGGGQNGTPKYQTVYGSNGNGGYYNPWASR